jgi:hypothetical protein
MSNAPSWLSCKNCLWYVFASEYGNPGCNLSPGDVIPRSGFSRCEEWTCKRCFEKWYQDHDAPVNHLYCKIIGRKRP